MHNIRSKLNRVVQHFSSKPNKKFASKNCAIVNETSALLIPQATKNFLDAQCSLNIARLADLRPAS